jgi:hypothetical protein
MDIVHIDAAVFNEFQSTWYRSIHDTPFEGTYACWKVDQACGSDYSGGVVERANYLELKKMAKDFPDHLRELHGGHGSYGIIVKIDDCPDALREIVEGLEDYPVIDDEAVLEQEWKNEAMPDAVSDCINILMTSLPSEVEVTDDITSVVESHLQQCDHWEMEQASAYCDVNKCASEIEKLPEWKVAIRDIAQQVVVDTNHGGTIFTVDGDVHRYNHECTVSEAIQWLMILNPESIINHGIGGLS